MQVDALIFQAAPQATLKLDATPANGATFADPLNGFQPGDALELQGLAYAPGATATVSGTTLAVVSAGTTEQFTLAGPPRPFSRSRRTPRAERW